MVLPWLWRYFRASTPQGALHSARAALPLIERSLIEHEALIDEAGAPELLRRTGWIKLFRSQASLDDGIADLERAGMRLSLVDFNFVMSRYDSSSLPLVLWGSCARLF